MMFSTVTPLVGQSDLKLTDLMTAGDFQRCGLQKLTDSERAALDGWLTGFAKKLLEFAAKNVTTTPAAAIDFASLEGSMVVAEDGQFLGKITRAVLDPQSLLNSLGRHGSELSSTSIFNELSRYGGEIAGMSPFNSLTSTPPRIFKGNAFIGYLTTNRAKTPRIDPHALIGWLKANQ